MEAGQEGMETFVAVDDAGNRVPVQVVRSGDNLVIFLNEGQSIEGVTNALQGMADGSGGQDQYQIMVTDNYLPEGQQVEGVQAPEEFQHVQDGSQVQEVQPVIDMEPEQTFSAETYQQYQVDEMVQGVQGVQVQPVSESGEVLDAFVPEAARAEGQEETAVTTFIPTIEGGTEAEGVNAFVSIASGSESVNTFVSIASGSESEGVSAFVSAVASGFQEPAGGGHPISNLPNVNIPIDSNFTQFDQTVVTYAPAEASSVTTGVAEGQFEQTTLATVETSHITTDQYGQTIVPAGEGAIEYSSEAGAAQLVPPGVATAEEPEGQLQIDLQRKPIEVVTDIGDLIVQPLPADTTAAVQTQYDKPFIATKVELPRATVGGSTIGQKITQTMITPARTPAGKGQGVSILLKCEKCDQVFFTASDLKSHREKVHGTMQDVGKLSSLVEPKLNGEGDANRNLCSICHIICATQHSLIKHKHEKHGMDMPFKCEVCNYSTTQKKYLEVHVKTHQKIHKCNICQNKFESGEKLQKHLTTHSRDKYQCFYCSKMYLTRKACTDHIALKHSGPQKNVQFVETKKEIAPASAAASTPKPGTSQSTAAAQTDYDTGVDDNLLAGKPLDSGFGENLLQDNLDQLANVAAAQADSQAPKIEEIDDKTEEEKVSEALKALEEASATYKYTEEQQSATDEITDNFPDDNGFSDDDAVPDDDAMETSGSQATDSKSDLEKLADGAVDIKPGTSSQPSPPKAPEGLEDFTPVKNRNFECLGCYSQFPTELLYQNHFLKDHCDENMCLLCGRDFAKRYLLRVHFHETHCNKDVYKCKNCDKMFNMVSKYWQHAQIHARRHVCRICNKAFSTATEMKRHETSVHYNKSYFCVYCPETFTSAGDLRKHKEDTHNIKRHGNKKDDNNSAKPKPDANKETPGTIVAGSTGSGAKNLIQQAKESGTQMTIKIFRDGTYQTTDPNTGKTDQGTIDLSNLGLDPSLLQTHNDLELVIIPPDKDDEQKDSAASDISSPKAPTPKKANQPKPPKVAGTYTVEKSLSPDGESVIRKQIVNEDRSFSCRFCPRTFRFYRHLRCHESAHSRDEKYVCHICQRMFVRETNLKLHLDLHEKKDISPSGKKQETAKPKVEAACEICGKVFTEKSKLTRHMKDVHKADPIVCQICNRSFRSESNAQRHMKQHYGPFPCTYCTEIFTDKEVLNDHVKETHQIKVHTCHLCGKELFSFGKLLSHLKIIHPEDEDAIKEVKESLKCDVCDKKFSNAKSVRAHRLTHTGEKKYQCPHCPWKFYLAYKLRKHIKVHEKSDVAPPGEKTRFPCDWCTKDFYSEAAVEKHERLNHKGPFQCQLCKAKKFPDKEKLKEHAEEKHAGNCFKCDVCELVFTSGRYLQIHHLNSHLKSNVCDKCGYAFQRKDEMYEHLKFNHFAGDEERFRAEYPEVHGPVEKTDYEELKKTKTCPRCSRTFKTYNGLVTHMKKCDGDKEKKEDNGKGDEEVPMEVPMEDEDGSPVKSEESTPVDKKKLRSNPVCPDCGKKFNLLAAVLSHMRYCKKGKKPSTKQPVKASKPFSPTKVKKEPEEDLSDSKDYVPYTYLETGHYVKCDQCQKTFSKRESLKKHMLIHAGITKKPEAEKSKARKSEKKSDTSDKEKSVDKGSKTSVSKASKFYNISKRKCEKCKVTFTCLFSLKRHMAKRHPESGIRMDTKLVNGNVESAKTKKVDTKTEQKTEEELKEIAKNQFLQMNFALGIKSEPSSDLTSPVVETVKTKRHYCSLCGLKFSREATLKKHLVEVHNEEDFYEEPESDSSSDSSSMETEPLPASPVKTRRMRDSESSTPKIKTESEESTPRTSERQKLKKGGKESTPKLDINRGKIKKEVEEIEPTPKSKGKKVTDVKIQPKVLRSTLTGRKVPKQKTAKKEVFRCKHCDRMFDFQRNLDRHLKYNHKDIKKIVSSLSTFKALRNKKTSYNLRVKKKLACLQKAKPNKPVEWPEPETRPSKIKPQEVRVKTEPRGVKEMRQKVESKAIAFKQSKPKHPIKPVVSSKAKQTVQKSFHKLEQTRKPEKTPSLASKQVKTPKLSFTKKPKKMSMTMVLGGILSQFLKKRISTILFECEFCKQQFPDKIKLNFHRRTKHSSKVICKSVCECSTCHEVFTELRLLLSHLASTHAVEPKKVEEITTEMTKQETVEKQERIFKEVIKSTDNSLVDMVVKTDAIQMKEKAEEEKNKELGTASLKSDEAAETDQKDSAGRDIDTFEQIDEIDAVSNDQVANDVVSGLDQSAKQSESTIQSMSESFALDSDLTSQYIELQKNGGHRETESEVTEGTFLESICNKTKESPKDDGGKSKVAASTDEAVKMSETEPPDSEAQKPDPFLPSGESQMEMDSNLPTSEVTATAGDKFLDEDAEVESLTNPVVHDVDMFTGTILSDGKATKRTETPVDSVIEGSGRLSRQSSKSETSSLKDKNKAFLKQCQVCLKRFHTEIGYSKHVQTHTEKKHECPKCDAFFRWEKNLKSHVQLFHSVGEVLVCKVCSKFFYEKDLFEKHYLIHLTKKFPCLQCKKNFSKQSLLKSHITEVHRNKEIQSKKKSSTEMSCGACNLKFDGIEKLLNHILLGHSEKKPAKMLFRERMYKYRCKFCPLLFKTKESQQSHLIVCDKRTVLVKKLYGQEVTDNTCSICGLKFKSKSQTFKHMQTIHGHKSRFQHIDFLKHPTVQTKYFCENCNGTFSKYSSYMMHEKALYGICSKKKKSSKHERCPFCKVLFASRLILGKHMIKVHNNYLFYSWKHCPYCKESFSKRLNLRKHLQAVHPEELKEGKKSAKAEGKKLVKKEGKVGKAEGKKPVKKSSSGSVSVEQLIKKNVVSKPKDTEDSKEISELDSRYRKIRQSAGIERHKCEYCGRVSWTISSYEEHLSKYHADRWIEKSVDSPGIVSSPLTDPRETVDSASTDDKKLGAVPVVMVHRLPVDLLVRSSENLVPEEKESPDKYLGVPYSFSDDVKQEGSETSKEAVVDLPLVDLDSVENLTDLPLDPPTTGKTEILTGSEGNDLQKEEVEDYLKPVTGGKLSTDTIGISESLPDEILASNVGTPVKTELSAKDAGVESERTEKDEVGLEAVVDNSKSQEQSTEKEESEEILTEMESEGVSMEEKTESDTQDTALESIVIESELLGENATDDNLVYQEMTGEAEDVTAQFENQPGAETGFETDLNGKETTEIENGNRENYDMGEVEPGTAFTTSGIEESAGYEEMEYEEMQMEGVTSTESHTDEMRTKGLQDENLGDYMQDPLEMIEENGNV